MIQIPPELVQSIILAFAEKKYKSDLRKIIKSYFKKPMTKKDVDEILNRIMASISMKETVDTVIENINKVPKGDEVIRKHLQKVEKHRKRTFG